MKKIARLLLASTALAPMLFFGTARAEKREDAAVSKTAQNPGFTQAIDVSQFRSFSGQAVYADGTPSSLTLLTSGQKSTMTLTVQRPDAGLARRSSVRIAISSQGAAGILTGAVITLNGKTFTEGTDWSIGSSSVATAKNISDAIDATENFIATYTFSGPTQAVVTASATATGVLHNAWAATVSTSAMTLSAATFTGGLDNGSVIVNLPANPVTLVQGTDWSCGGTSSATAKAIADAFQANSSIAAVFSSTWNSAGVVTSTSLYNGVYNYNVNGVTSMTIAGYMNGTASDVSTANDTITRTSHGLFTGLPVMYSTTATQVAIGGLTNAVTYYAIRSSADVFKLATSTTNAVAGTAIDLTTLPDITASTYTFTVPALSLAAGNGFFWSASNDGTNFTTLSTVTYSSVTYSAAGNSLWDFGSFPYKYLKINFVGPTFGGFNLDLKLYGLREGN